MKKQSNFTRTEQMIQENFDNALEKVLREGAKKLLVSALEHEIEEYLAAYKHSKDNNGHQYVVRNGYCPEREIVTGIGPLSIKKPRVHDRSGQCQFTSTILPKYLRRMPSIDNLIPVLYLKGISTGDFRPALRAILGDNVTGLSATNIVRLKQVWESDYKNWNKRDLSNKHYVYFWVDGIYFNVRLDEHRQCILVIIGATSDGKKELVAVSDGYRESKQSWREVLLDLQYRGLKTPPELAVGDGALGFWSALNEVFSTTRHQRCWVHKTANILDKMPKSIQAKAKSMIHEMYQAETRKDAFKSYDEFLKVYKAKYPKACECLIKDKDVLFTFYDFPAQHWVHLRSTNPIESTFATVRLRTKRTKGCGSRIATLTMVFKLVQEAEKSWARLRGYKLIPLVMQGKQFVDGILKAA